MVKCFAIDNSLTIHTTGEIKPCCKYKGNFGYLETTDIKVTDFQQLAKEEWPSGCAKCKNAEQNNIRSRRQSYETRFNDGGFLLDISLGNFCNLKCRMCNEQLSTSWFSDAKKLNRTVPPIFQISEAKIDEIFNLLESKETAVIELKGGEPLINPNAEYFFNKVINSNCKIRLNCITNGTKIPNWFVDLLPKLDIELQMSIDGIQQTYEYVRGDKSFSWKNCVEQMIYLESLDIKVSYNYVVQNLTINDMLEFEQMTKRHINWIILDNPVYLTCNIVPDYYKGIILEKLQKMNTMPPALPSLFLKQYDINEYTTFIRKTAFLDKLRNQDLRKSLPHLINAEGRKIYDSI